MSEPTITQQVERNQAHVIVAQEHLFQALRCSAGVMAAILNHSEPMAKAQLHEFNRRIRMAVENLKHCTEAFE